MNLNADFSARASVHCEQIAWVPSPMVGVERKMLDRIGGEVARATSVVRYAPGSAFSPHVHTGGEEFLVLEGVFQDEHGDYPAGSYVRNPPQSSHTPRSEHGCTILVKLWQFDQDDRHAVKLRSADLQLTADPAAGEVQASVLHEDANETVRVERWAPGSTRRAALPGGAELFVLDGGFDEHAEGFGVWSWLRLPAGATLDARASQHGATVWVKTRHLARPQAAPAS